jgi:hypothetical protein
VSSWRQQLAAWRRELGDAIVLLATAWWVVTVRGLAGDPVGWRGFAVGVASTSLWATVLGLALCEFTNAHALVSGVLG